VLEACAESGLRAEIDLRNEKINYKVREHSLAKIPVMFVVGKREAEERTVSIRRLGSQAQETLTLREAIERISAEAIPPDLAREKEPSKREAA
jgi:threonyl-tRNA synthetase